MSQITDFLPQLQQLRSIYSDFIQLDQMDLEAYRKVVDFYYAHRDATCLRRFKLSVVNEIEREAISNRGGQCASMGFKVMGRYLIIFVTSNL